VEAGLFWVKIRWLAVKDTSHERSVSSLAHFNYFTSPSTIGTAGVSSITLFAASISAKLSRTSPGLWGLWRTSNSMSLAAWSSV